MRGLKVTNVNKEAGDRIRFKLSLADQVGAAFHQNVQIQNTKAQLSLVQKEQSLADNRHNRS